VHTGGDNIQYKKALFASTVTDHEAIVPKEIFYRHRKKEPDRQASTNPQYSEKQKGRKEKSKYSSKYALTDIMVCRKCGQPYRRQKWLKYRQKMVCGGVKTV
jgi:site-specific DNA recombinase